MIYFSYVFSVILNLILFLLCFLFCIYYFAIFASVSEKYLRKIYRRKFLLGSLMAGVSLTISNILFENYQGINLWFVYIVSIIIILALYFVSKYGKALIDINYNEIKKAKREIKIYWLIIISSFSLIILSIYIDKLINITLIPVLVSFLVVPISSLILKHIENKEVEIIKKRIYFINKQKNNKTKKYLNNIKRFYLDMQINIYIVCLSFVSSYIFTKCLLIIRYETLDQVFNLIRIDNSESFFTMMVSSLLSLLVFLFLFRFLLNISLKKLGIKVKEDNFFNINRPQL